MATLRKPSPRSQVRQARNTLKAATLAYATAYGEAQRVNGMRHYRQDDDGLYHREMRLWRLIGQSERQVNRALAAYTRALRKAAK